MQVIERSLQGEVELVMAPTLRDARETLKPSEFQLIVLGLGMPGGSGIELLGQLGTLTSRPTPTE
jgi:DNA-binding response OmpR family regulator